jgi:hypothetical protein
MTTPKTPTTATAAARLPQPENGSATALATATSAQLATVMACQDYANQPAIQAIAKTLQTDNTTFLSLLAAWEKAKASLPTLEAAWREQMAVVRRDRHTLAGAITTASNGSTAAIASWGAVPSDNHGALTPSTAAPTGLASMTSKVSGTLKAKCAVIDGAASYFWALTADPTVSPTATPPIVTTGSRVSIPGQTVGHVVYLRVSVLRRRGGQSAWSDALQITVR